MKPRYEAFRRLPRLVLCVVLVSTAAVTSAASFAYANGAANRGEAAAERTTKNASLNKAAKWVDIATQAS